MKYMVSLSVAGLALLSTSCVQGSEAEGRAISADDYYDMVQLSGPQLSPDGRHTALIQRVVKGDKRGWHSNLWLVDNSGDEAPRQFTFSNVDYGVRWSPDGGTLLLNSGRGDNGGLYTLRLAGGEARPLLSLEQGSIGDYQWAPDGEHVLLSISLEPEVDGPRTEADDETDNDTADVEEARHAVYKAQGRYLDDSQQSLWLYSIADDKLSPLTQQSGFDEGDAQFSPDGGHIAFTSNRDPEHREGVYSQSLFVLALDAADGSEALEAQLQTPSGVARSPRWLDANTLVYLHSAEPYAPTSLRSITLDGNSEVLVEQLELMPSNLEVVNGELWFTAMNHGSTTLHRFDPQSGEFSTIAGEGYSLSQLSINQHGAAYVKENEQTLPELYFNPLTDAASATRLTAFNQALQDELALGAYQSFHVSDDAGFSAQGFFLEPLNRADGEQYPLILNIKGGPGGMWGHQFMQEMQLMAARGYAVVFVNYRGSSGYGQDFSDQVRLDYGGADYRDNMLALEHVLDTYDWIDADRLFVTGGSHGGFLTNWITTQTDRFKAAVTQRSVSNWLSEAGTQAFPPASMQVEFGGTIWQNYDYYWDRSPLKYADRVTTPTLIIHSTDDHITPIGQGEEWFYALKANGVDTEMAVFQNEGHGLSRNGAPINLVERLNRIIDWFDRYDD
ncbi:S9 family peptidase [Aliidiomarina soli]|uniref:S9 family peptidase n=1 Tax=Aliidiomarina soli TaxID=1928574 RepID=A0A432WMA6_9GAMM|nr:S9 family peptidase [Aliidiomarina soli]RUO34894.1 S9 family peptidase [Aliidiomarina soli]